MGPFKGGARVQKKREQEQAESARQQREAARTLLTLRLHAEEVIAQAEGERLDRESAARAGQEAQLAATRQQHAYVNRFDYSLANPITHNGKEYYATTREGDSGSHIPLRAEWNPGQLKDYGDHVESARTWRGDLKALTPQANEEAFIPPGPSQEEANFLMSFKDIPCDFALFPGRNDYVDGKTIDQGEETEPDTDLEYESEQSTRWADFDHGERQQSAADYGMDPFCPCCQDLTRRSERQPQEGAASMHVGVEQVEMASPEMLRVNSGPQPGEPTLGATSHAECPTEGTIPAGSNPFQAVDGRAVMQPAPASGAMGPPRPPPSAPPSLPTTMLPVLQVEELVRSFLRERRRRAPRGAAEACREQSRVEMAGEKWRHMHIW